jgi:Ca2+-binding EF-hand superfamily protein
MVFKTHYLNPVLSILALCSTMLATTVLADNKNLLILADDRTLTEETDDGGLEKTLEHNFSPDDRARLRKALADYAKSTDPVHTQIEQKRKAMQESIEKRFNECNKDNDDSLDREEATLCLPQIARHFSYVDVDEDGVITLEELQLAQAKLIERQKAAEARMEAQKIQEAEIAIKEKSKAKDNKQAANIRKRPS